MATCVMLALGLVIVTTIYQIAISLLLVTGKFNSRKANVYRKAGNWCSIMLFGLTHVTVFCFYAINQFTWDYLAVVYSASYAVISLFYLVTMMLLKNSFDNLDLMGLNKEKVSVFT